VGGLGALLKWQSTCLAHLRLWVQIPIPPKTNPKILQWEVSFRFIHININFPSDLSFQPCPLGTDFVFTNTILMTLFVLTHLWVGSEHFLSWVEQIHSHLCRDLLRFILERVLLLPSSNLKCHGGWYGPSCFYKVVLALLFCLANFWL
jgi:hypothetical protein